MGECSKCGECCRWLVIASKKNLAPWDMKYLRERCDMETNEAFFIDKYCKHARRRYDLEGQPVLCDIYNERPIVCREYCGKRYTNGHVYFVPDGCTMGKP